MLPVRAEMGNGEVDIVVFGERGRCGSHSNLNAFAIIRA